MEALGGLQVRHRLHRGAPPAQDDVTYTISLENDGEPEVYPGKPEATE